MLPPGPGVTKANFDRITVGMTPEQVEDIFGQPGVMAPHEGKLEGWWVTANGSDASILFSDCGVACKSWHDSEETYLQRLRRWLHLP